QQELQGRLESGLIVDYSGLLNNAAFESGEGAPRSSFERIALERQALQSCLRALALAKTPRERSEAIAMVGLVHESWGFPYDAYLPTGRAAAAVRPTREAVRQASRFLSPSASRPAHSR